MTYHKEDIQMKQGKIKGLKFGDIIINYWASEDNPHRRGIFVRYKKNLIQCTDGKGDFWKTTHDGKSKFRKV